MSPTSAGLSLENKRLSTAATRKCFVKYNQGKRTDLDFETVERFM